MRYAGTKTKKMGRLLYIVLRHLTRLESKTQSFTGSAGPILREPNPCQPVIAPFRRRFTIITTSENPSRLGEWREMTGSWSCLAAWGMWYGASIPMFVLVSKILTEIQMRRCIWISSKVEISHQVWVSVFESLCSHSYPVGRFTVGWTHSGLARGQLQLVL